MTRASIAVAIFAFALQAPPQRFKPAPVTPSDLVVRIEQVGQMPGHANPTSPIVAGSRLILIDQAGLLFTWNGSQVDPLLGPPDVPRGLKLAGAEHVLNAAVDAAGSTVYAMFLAASPPSNIPRRQSPREPDAWYVLYAFAFDGSRLSSPRPITAMQVRTEGHVGGGLAVLPDGSVLFAVGDNGDSFEDGRTAPQDPAVHLGKLVRIDPASGRAVIVGLGVRCVQRLVVTGSGPDARLIFTDPGGWVSEELNSVPIAALSETAPVNFGWGRAADRLAREGTFHIDTAGNSTARLAAAEPGFADPVAEFGREEARAVAISGPVVSTVSFSRITALVGDLVGGAVMATVRPLTEMRQALHRVSLVDNAGRTVTLNELAGGNRADLRFFNFPDGTAGLLLERTGNFYRLTEVKKESVVPVQQIAQAAKQRSFFTSSAPQTRHR